MRALTLILAAVGTPALAAGDKPFFSLANTDFAVTIGFLLFIGILVYFKVFRTLGDMLDKRADGIQAELDEARQLRDEAKALLAGYERRSAEVSEQSKRIVDQAREEAKLAADQAKIDLEKSIERRLAAAEDQIASAQAGAVKEVRDRAITVAVAAARDVIGSDMTAKEADALIDASIEEVGRKLH